MSSVVAMSTQRGIIAAGAALPAGRSSQLRALLWQWLGLLVRNDVRVRIVNESRSLVRRDRIDSGPRDGSTRGWY